MDNRNKALAPTILILAGLTACGLSGSGVSVGLNEEFEPVYTVPAEWNDGQVRIFEELIQYSEGEVRNEPEPEGDAACYEFNQRGRSVDSFVAIYTDSLKDRYPISDSEAAEMAREVITAWAVICPD